MTAFADQFTSAMPHYFEPLPDLGMCLERMGLDPNGDYSPSYDNLVKLMYGIFDNIPFESLDCSDFRNKVDFYPAHLFDKIVLHHRGGYCFEINGFFYSVLKDLGYDCIPLAGRLLNGQPVFGGMGHRTTVAFIDGKRYLCDVGFGSGLAADGPLDVDEPSRQMLGGKEYTIVQHPGALFGDITLIRHQSDGSETLVYTVYLTPNTVMDFVPANERAEVGFRNRRICRKRYTQDGKEGIMAIDGKIYRKRLGGETVEIEITSFPQLYQILVDDFGMIIPRNSFSDDWPKEFAYYKLKD